MTISLVADPSGTSGKLQVSGVDVATAKNTGILDVPKGIGGIPAFRAYRNTAYSSGAGTPIQLVCDVEDFDTTSNYDTSTGLFSPTVPGYYHVDGAVQVAEAHTVRAGILKNGTVEAYGAPATYSSVVSCLVYLNGSDSLKLGIADSTGNFNITTGRILTYFSAVLVRAA